MDWRACAIYGVLLNVGIAIGIWATWLTFGILSFVTALAWMVCAFLYAKSEEERAEDAAVYAMFSLLTLAVSWIVALVIRPLVLAFHGNLSVGWHTFIR